MQRPKHIRDGKIAKAKVMVKAKVAAIVAANLADPILKAKPVVHTANGRKFTQGFKTTADLRNGYVFTNPSNLGRRSNAGMDGTKWGVK